MHLYKEQRKATCAVRSEDSSYLWACRGLLEVSCVCVALLGILLIWILIWVLVTYIIVICLLFCMHIIFQNKIVLLNVCEKRKFHNSTYTMNPLWLTSTCQYRTPGRIYTQIVLSGWWNCRRFFSFFFYLFLKTIFSTACILFIMYYFYKSNYT